MMKESDILYETGKYWVCVSQRGKKYGFEVLRNVGTHSVVCAIVGLGENLGLPRAIQEADKRAKGEI